MVKNLERKSLVLTIILLLVSFVSFCQPASEGFDPMLQITHQFAHPNLAIVLDVTGSMGWEILSEFYVGVDSTGYPFWKYDNYYGRTSWPSKYGSWPGGNARYVHVYILVGNRPSRMAVVKNALGNSVTLYEWQPPATFPSPLNGWTYGGTDQSNGLPFYWKTSSSSSRPSAPSTLNQPTSPCPDTTPLACPIGTITAVKCPRDLIGSTSNMVNWALIIYSTNYADCSLATVKTVFDLSESGDVTDIENALKLYSAGGLNANGRTNTFGAMTFAKQFIQKSITGGKITYYGNKSINVNPDWKFAACNRTYGVILVTDGMSNDCNPNGKNWVNPCSSTNPNYMCDASGGTYDCDRGTRLPTNPTPSKPRNYPVFPPGPIEQLYLSTVNINGTNYPTKAKTWVIGVSPSVNPCELNFDAYMGRTDASAPKGDAGFDSVADADRQPSSLGDETTYNNNDPRVTGKPYAFFASNADALAQAFADIVAGVATGDYSTSAPVANPTSTTGGSDVYLATTDFPEWKGHLYCFNAAADPVVLRYDAGELLANKPATERKIYTWNSSKQLVEVSIANYSQLKSIASSFNPSFDSSRFTTQLIDFIRGNDGNGATRTWKLGPLVNSTPTLVMSPQKYEQGYVDSSHADFVNQYADRLPLIYVGSDDGMMHCFVTVETTVSGKTYAAGEELFAIIPPNLLSMQADLYDTFVNTGIPTGQPKDPKNHIYGVANSPKYGDIYYPNEGWKTVLFLTEGAGGDMVAALDITDPFGKLTNSTPQDPVDVLWYHTSSTCSYLKKTWSLPAAAPIDPTTFKGVMGSGYDSVNNSTYPNMIIFNPVDGTYTLKSIGNASTYYLRNQAFADSVIFQTNAKEYFPDNLADLGLQADLHGRIWFWDRNQDSFFVGIDATAKAGHPQPIYYPPAVSGYKKGTETYDLYVFASGTYYEHDTDITGPQVGDNNKFEPSIFIAVSKPWGTSAVSSSNILRIPIKTLTYKDENGQTQTVGKRTQVTTSPILLIPTNDSSSPQAVFSIYDPDTLDCAGTSYIVIIKINIDSNGEISATTSGYSAGTGAVSGFAVMGQNVVIAKSGVGEGESATISKVPGLTIQSGSGQPTPVWWRELQ